MHVDALFYSCFLEYSNSFAEDRKNKEIVHSLITEKQIKQYYIINTVKGNFMRICIVEQREREIIKRNALFIYVEEVVIILSILYKIMKRNT